MSQLTEDQTESSSPVFDIPPGSFGTPLHFDLAFEHAAADLKKEEIWMMMEARFVAEVAYMSDRINPNRTTANDSVHFKCPG